jgi:hypothetical protein
MRERYTYEIATSTSDGRWNPTVVRDDTFSRDPRSIARSLLEQWINDHQGRLPGGRVFVYAGSASTDSARIIATVRVRVFRGDLYHREHEPVAVAYLGHAESEFGRSRPLEPRTDPGGSTSTYRMHRVRFRLRLPSPRRTARDGGDGVPVRVIGTAIPQAFGRCSMPPDAAA